MRLDGAMTWKPDVPAAGLCSREAFGVRPRRVRDEPDDARTWTADDVPAATARSVAAAAPVVEPRGRVVGSGRDLHGFPVELATVDD